MKHRNISLRSLNDNEMREQQSHLLVGTECGCGCNGSSTHSPNLSANFATGYNPAYSCNDTDYDGSHGHRMQSAHMKREIFLSIMVLLLIATPKFAMYAQRKDSDAKISHTYYRYGCLNRKVIDEAGLRILYAFNPVDINDKSTWIDEGQLKVGKGFTQYSSHFEEVNEDSLAKWLADHPSSSVYPPARWIQGHRPDYWIEYQYSNINVNGNVLEEWAAMPRAIEEDNLMYSEPFPLQKWQMEKETKEVCGYRCQKATCCWRGRVYTAWFTTDIPVPSGPWKFGGLPGLIMKISDSTNEYSWEAVAINKGKFPVYGARRKKYVKSTREKVQKLQRQLNENYFKTTGEVVIQFKTGRQISSRKHAYSPLELE